MEWWPYLSLFGVAFLAATLFPAQSELALAGLLAAGRYDPGLLILAATAGNVLGSAANWVVGRYLHRFRDRRWFPIPGAALNKAERSYRRWGYWTLLLSWVPVIGDPLTLVAGLLRTPLWLFLGFVTLAKGGRYLVVAGLIQIGQ
jgi:membrane protein YqaA with SNARE-associated domain